jgi:magnesium chelatase subunit I
MKEVLEEFARLARSSPAINQQSGVSVRMSIANMENAISNSERRGIMVGESPAVPRITDLLYLAASTRGKIELTLSEDEGQEDRVIHKLLGEAVKNVFEAYCDVKQFRSVVEAFESGKTFPAGDRVPSAEYSSRLSDFPALKTQVGHFLEKLEENALTRDAKTALTASAIEFVLEGLHVENRLNRNAKGDGVVFKK